MISVDAFMLAIYMKSIDIGVGEKRLGEEGVLWANKGDNITCVDEINSGVVFSDGV